MKLARMSLGERIGLSFLEGSLRSPTFKVEDSIQLVTIYGGVGFTLCPQQGQ